MPMFLTGGSLRPNQTTNVSLQYDASLLPGQGRYDSDILVTMSEQPYAKARCRQTYLLQLRAWSEPERQYDVMCLTGPVVALQAYAATFLLFCAQLSAVRQSGLQHTAHASFSLIQDGLPAPVDRLPDWTVVAAAACATCIFAEVAVRCKC
jgi:hypothetical protein